MLHDGQSIRVAVVGGLRIPFCRAHSVYRGCSNQDMMTATLSALVNKYDLKDQTLGDVALGAVIKHSKDWNLARESVIGSGLSLKTPAFDLQRACGTSIEACIQIANKIALGQIKVGIAGGADSISDSPIVYRDGLRRILLDSHGSRSVMGKILPWFRLRPPHLVPKLPGIMSWLEQPLYTEWAQERPGFLTPVFARCKSCHSNCVVRKFDCST